MESTSHFYRALKQAVLKARTHVSIYAPDLTEALLKETEGFLWLKTSLLKALKSFIKYDYAQLELFHRDAERIAPLFKNNSGSVYIKPALEKDFVKPLQSFAESFAIIDGETVLVMPYNDYASPIGFISTHDENRALYFQQLMTQIIRHERELDNYQPATEAVLQLGNTPLTHAQTIAWANELKPYKTTNSDQFNPYVNHLLNYQERKYNE